MVRLLTLSHWTRLLLVWLLCLSAAGAAPVDEYAVKAAYLYNLTRFTQWPEDVPPPSQPFRLCILGNDPFGAALRSLRDKTVDEQPLRVRYLGRTGPYEDCHLLFISRSERHRVKPLLFRLQGRPVLTVSDMDNFARSGGMVELVEQDQRIGFAVNLASARDAGLKISSKLLRLATHVMQ